MYAVDAATSSHEHEGGAVISTSLMTETGSSHYMASGLGVSWKKESQKAWRLGI